MLLCHFFPQNVLLEVGTRRVKLADFGQAKKDRQTNVTRGVGTLEYMPPELFNIDDDIQDSANVLAIDIYAISIILWQLWFQRKPYSGFSMQKIIAHITKGKRLAFLEPEGGAQLTTPSVLQELIVACWDSDPAKRPKIDDVVTAFVEQVTPAVTKLIVCADGTTAAGDAPALAPGEVRAPDRADKSTPKAGPQISQAGTSRSRQRMDMAAFLEKAALGKHSAKIEELGFTDIEMLSDRELLDDETLASVVGMSKMEIRKFRALVESSGTSPTMTKSFIAARSPSTMTKKQKESALGVGI